MATTARQSKGSRKGAPEPSNARRTSAWGTGARASPTFSSTNAPATRQQPPAQSSAQQSPAPAPSSNAPTPPASFPPLVQNPPQAQTTQPRPDAAPTSPRDRVLQSLSGLTGTTITLVTKTAQRYEGVIESTAGDGDTKGVTLKDVKDVTNPGAPLKDSLFIASTSIESYTSGPADARPTNGDSFRTDTDITQRRFPAGGRERDLQAWVPSGDVNHVSLGDDDTFSLSANGTTSWDQFSVNEQLFGVKASFDEDVYTTKLDRSAPDFKERERKAQKIANEIIGATTNNPHIAEERGIVDDSGVNEEDKYGAVVRGQNAYVPPGARSKGGVSFATPPVASPAEAKPDIPKLSVNGPDGASVSAAQAPSPPSSKAASPTPAANKPPADPLPAFRDFVKDEKNRLNQKRQALVKSEMDKRMAELVKFSQSFKLNKPIPEDLVPILAKDEDRQKQIKEKAKADATSAQARAIGPSTPATASRGVAVAGLKIADSRKQVSQALAGKGGAAGGANGTATGLTATSTATAQKTAANANAVASASASSSAIPSPAPAKSNLAPNGAKKINMVIQSIPPFRGGAAKAKTSPTNAAASANGTPAVNAVPSSTSNLNVNANAGKNAPLLNTNVNKGANAMSPMSPNTAAANRLNVNASSFRPNPKANAFNPVIPASKSGATGPNGTPANSTGASNSPKPKSDSAPVTPNPFFGTRPIKRSTPVHVKDDFNPFKHNKVVDASQVSALWPYSGKRYMLMFPAPQHPPNPHPAHMGPPPIAAAPMPPPSYEDSAAQEAQQHRGYVYAYPPYGYPPQHMMPGMAPPGPPYMPGPYMQPMPYPPGMPPPNGVFSMYSPAMGQMPPPGAYMQPPPPGAYPPPPNGAGPRPSMPPTPIPSHAHPYYHQSPQLQHAYPMMMPPPPNLPPHGYEGPAPPVPMGGHA